MLAGFGLFIAVWPKAQKVGAGCAEAERLPSSNTEPQEWEAWDELIHSIFRTPITSSNTFFSGWGDSL